MTKPRHDVEFRESAVAAVDAGERVSDVAHRLGIHPDTLHNWLRLRQKTGSVRGRRMRLSTRELEVLRILCLARPEATNEQMVELLAEACGARMSVRAIGNERRRLGFRPVKVPRPTWASPEVSAGQPGGYRNITETPRGRYPSDLTDEQWELIAPFIPVPQSASAHDRRLIVDAILYVLRTGCQWRALPHDFPDWKTVYHVFRTWRNDGVWERANAALRERVRIRDGRKPTPSAAIMDTQVAKTTEKGGPVATMAESA